MNDEEDFDEELALFDKYSTNDATKNNEQAKIYKTEKDYFGKFGYGRKMERKLINDEIIKNQSKGITKSISLIDENISDLIKKRGRDALEKTGLDDKNYVRDLMSRSRENYLSSSRRSTPTPTPTDDRPIGGRRHTRTRKRKGSSRTRRRNGSIRTKGRKRTTKRRRIRR
jgi:hypothetical protein